jgi:excisionase family DNA binding protein
MSISMMAQPLGLPPVDVNQSYSTREACQYLRCARGTLYQLINDDVIIVQRRGGRTFVPGSELARLARCPEQSDPRTTRGRPPKAKAAPPTPLKKQRRLRRAS